MTYRELFYTAKRLIEHHQITLGEYEEMTKPLDREVEQEPVLDKIRADMLEEMSSHSGTGEEVIQAYVDGLRKGLEFIDKYRLKEDK